ncbi:Crp/Fnr family transcriptional regulator [Cognatilysobacter lacus]|uniref:CRP-like protein Clp n=1 Tax=Cognatilysobacter lacus TaxID=1643323 RepID=A0A5D8Z7F7_9GAMM|nr:helix-turn-helix domain-containing protein [Lysobacter lacus]TZF90013.1 helix-turn-helix domain-containing protein [Lysobacter lacus]
MSNVVSLHPHGPALPGPPDVVGIDPVWAGARLPVRRVRRKHMLYRAGQPATCVFVVRVGTFKTVLLSAQGEERVTGFQVKGDALGLEALDIRHHVCDAMALDVGEVIEIPKSALREHRGELVEVVADLMAQTFRREWEWKMALSLLDAEQRVVHFLLDFAHRQAALGLGGDRILLRMTRADLGSFLDLSLESVTRALSRLDSAGLIRVACRDVELLDEPALGRVLAVASRRH